MESEWIKKQNYESKRKALGLDTAASDTKKAKTTHPAPPPVLATNATANSTEVTAFRAEFQKGTQIMLDLLVTLKEVQRLMEKADGDDGDDKKSN